MDASDLDLSEGSDEYEVDDLINLNSEASDYSESDEDEIDDEVATAYLGKLI